MDYTTTTMVKASLGISGSTLDALLARYVTEASRTIDRHCSGMQNSDNYFEAATVTNEEVSGQVDMNGNILCQARKAKVSSVSALSYRRSPLEDWISVNTDYVTIDGYNVMAWTGLGCRGKVFVKMSYAGGQATSVSGLPADLSEATTILAIRLYEENKSGLGDVVGISELGQVYYSKAMPQRVDLLLGPYRRVQ